MEYYKYIAHNLVLEIIIYNILLHLGYCIVEYIFF